MGGIPVFYGETRKLRAGAGMAMENLELGAARMSELLLLEWVKTCS